jgi:hypothetical protein
VIEGLDFNLHTPFTLLPFAPAVSRHGLDHKGSIEVEKTEIKIQKSK